MVTTQAPTAAVIVIRPTTDLANTLNLAAPSHSHSTDASQNRARAPVATWAQPTVIRSARQLLGSRGRGARARPPCGSASPPLPC